LDDPLRQAKAKAAATYDAAADHFDDAPLHSGTVSASGRLSASR
jgi:hypothetical protein